MNAVKELVTVCLKALPIGTVRDWSGIKYKKMNNGEWEVITQDKQKKEDKWKESFKYLKELETAFNNNNKEKFIELLRERDKRMTGFGGDEKSRDKFLKLVNQGIKKFNAG